MSVWFKFFGISCPAVMCQVAQPMCTPVRAGGDCHFKVPNYCDFLNSDYTVWKKHGLMVISIKDGSSKNLCLSSQQWNGTMWIFWLTFRAICENCIFYSSSFHKPWIGARVGKPSFSIDPVNFCLHEHKSGICSKNVRRYIHSGWFIKLKTNSTVLPNGAYLNPFIIMVIWF